MNLFRWIGIESIHFAAEAGRIMILFAKTLSWTFRPPLQGREIIKQMQEVGVRSFPVVIITAAFTGMILALQSYFHGTYWHNDYGRPRSHGCVNLRSEAAKFIYRWSLPNVPVDADYVHMPGEGTRVQVI